ncbi:MAG: F0F1 ATP synthase subunit A [Gemmatimonadales bacterium]|nr:MAG: F0F1 ATP synthase subunit A [Gemmatimonadales bacterium]
MTRLLRFAQEHAQETAEYGAEAAQHGPEEFDLGGTIMHHLVDASELELPWGAVHLPSGWYVNLGPLGTVDLAPTKHVVLMVAAAILVFAVFALLGRAVRRAPADRAPQGFANAIESMVLYFRDEVVRPNIGHGADSYTPYILTVFFFILTMNLLGLVPWGGSATGNISVTAALAICTFVLVEVSGMRTLGFKGYMGTIFYAPHGMHPAMRTMMLVIMTPVEILGKLTKPFALAVRLFANMTAGHTLIFALGGLGFVFMASPAVWAGVTVGTTLMATAIMLLEVFVAFLQAYIFAMLTSVFVGLIKHAH